MNKECRELFGNEFFCKSDTTAVIDLPLKNVLFLIQNAIFL